MRQRELEHKAQLDAVSHSAQEAELKLKSCERELIQTKERNVSLRDTVEQLQQSVQEAEKVQKAIQWELDDVQQIKNAKIAELEEEKVRI